MITKLRDKLVMKYVYPTKCEEVLSSDDEQIDYSKPIIHFFPEAPIFDTHKRFSRIIIPRIKPESIKNINNSHNTIDYSLLKASPYIAICSINSNLTNEQISDLIFKASKYNDYSGFRQINLEYLFTQGMN